jgi:hypothetical protein
MTQQIAISLLSKGRNGNEILKVLDALTESPDDLMVAVGQSRDWHKVD